MNRKVIYQRIELDDLVYDSVDLTILNGLAHGKSREELGKICFKSKRTIDSRIDKMAGAMLVDGQMGVVLKAISLGIIKNPYEQLKRPDAVYN